MAVPGSNPGKVEARDHQLDPWVRASHSMAGLGEKIVVAAVAGTDFAQWAVGTDSECPVLSSWDYKDRWGPVDPRRGHDTGPYCCECIDVTRERYLLRVGRVFVRGSRLYFGRRTALVEYREREGPEVNDDRGYGVACVFAAITMA